MEKTGSLRAFHAIAIVTVLAGALASLDLMLKAGRNNDSFLLIVLFAGWVLLPFAALLIVDLMSRRWLLSARKTFYWLMIVLSILSVVVYTGVFSPKNAKPAFIFLVVPLLSWLLIAIMITIAVSRSRRQAFTQDQSTGT